MRPRLSGTPETSGWALRRGRETRAERRFVPVIPVLDAPLRLGEPCCCEHEISDRTSPPP